MAKQKNPGKVFEDEIKASCVQEGLFIHRVKDTSQSYTYSAIFTPKNPCDFFIFKMPILLAVECKHTKNGSMSIQRSEDEDRDKMIKYHQIIALTEFATHEGVEAGFLLSFLNESTQVETTFYLPIENFNRFLASTEKKSINMSDVMRHNPIIVNQTKKRRYYTFAISELFDNIQKRRAKYAEDDI